MRTRTRRTCYSFIVPRICLFVVVVLSAFAVLPAQTGYQPARAATASVDSLIARCPTAKEIAAVDARLALTFEQDPTAGNLVCSAADGSADLTLLQERAYQALLVMRALEFDTPLPWTTAPLYDWFTSAVTGIRFRGDISISFCCDPANVINVQTQNIDALQTDRWLSPDHPAGMQGLVVLLAHEARHNEGYPHTCGNDDQNLQEMGAWAIQYYLFAWLAGQSDPAFLTPDPPFPGLGTTYYQDQAAYNAELTLSRFCDLGPTEAAVDIMPGSCPNRFNVNGQGSLAVAILGTSTFDVTHVDPASVTLAGVPALLAETGDVASPFVPFTGKTAAKDCTKAGPDGRPDLVLQFDYQAVAAALGPVTKNQVIVVELTGNLSPAFGGTSLSGEDVVVIVKKKAS